MGRPVGSARRLGPNVEQLLVERKGSWLRFCNIRQHRIRVERSYDERILNRGQHVAKPFGVHVKEGLIFEDRSAEIDAPLVGIGKRSWRPVVIGKPIVGI